jgi:hypothetical protein
MSGARLGCPLLTARLPCGTGEIRYRCFLPDLTEFAAPSCTGPNYQQSTSHLKNNIRLETLPFTDTVWFGSLAFYASGGEGGIRTLGTLIRGTHDFQSCTFNRSVTSPCRYFKYLGALPCYLNRQRLQNVSMGYFCDVLRGLSTTYHTEVARAKSNCHAALSYTSETPATEKKFCSSAMLHMHVSTMSPRSKAVV